jgi:hydrogenase maturation protease
MLFSLVSTHSIFGVEGGALISLLDPPQGCEAMAANCKNIGTWPVLVGEQDSRQAMLSSPIILYDYPQIAPESPGSLFDGTEIDEILSLRIMTLTDEEKCEIRQSDDRAREVLDRTENLPEEQFMKLHGILRGLQPAKEGVR